MERFKLDITYENPVLTIEISDTIYNNHSYTFDYYVALDDDIFTNNREYLYQYLKKNPHLDYTQLQLDIENWIQKCYDSWHKV